MTDDRSNSAARIDALLAQAKDHITKGTEHYRLAREAVLAARTLDPRLSNRAIAKALGRSHNWVNKLLLWSGTDGSTPFGGDPANEADDLPELNQEPVSDPILRKLDAIEMNNHVLIVVTPSGG